MKQCAECGRDFDPESIPSGKKKRNPNHTRRIYCSKGCNHRRNGRKRYRETIESKRAKYKRYYERSKERMKPTRRTKCQRWRDANPEKSAELAWLNKVRQDYGTLPPPEVLDMMRIARDFRRLVGWGKKGGRVGLIK